MFIRKRAWLKLSAIKQQLLLVCPTWYLVNISLRLHRYLSACLNIGLFAACILSILESFLQNEYAVRILLFPLYCNLFIIIWCVVVVSRSQNVASSCLGSGPVVDGIGNDAKRIYKRILYKTQFSAFLLSAPYLRFCCCFLCLNTRILLNSLLNFIACRPSTYSKSNFVTLYKYVNS